MFFWLSCVELPIFPDASHSPFVGRIVIQSNVDKIICDQMYRHICMCTQSKKIGAECSDPCDTVVVSVLLSVVYVVCNLCIHLTHNGCVWYHGCVQIMCKGKGILCRCFWRRWSYKQPIEKNQTLFASNCKYYSTPNQYWNISIEFQL